MHIISTQLDQNPYSYALFIHLFVVHPLGLAASYRASPYWGKITCRAVRGASSVAHKILSERLSQVTSKSEAIKTIKSFVGIYVKDRAKQVRAFKCG